MKLFRCLTITFCLLSFSCLANCDEEVKKMNVIMDEWGIESLALNNEYKKTLKKLAESRGVTFSKMLFSVSIKIIKEDFVLSESERNTSEKSNKVMSNLASGYCKLYVPNALELVESLRENYVLKIGHFEKLIKSS